MDLSNTLWLCFICAGLTCIRNIISQRLGADGRGLKRSMARLARKCYVKQRPETSAPALLTALDSQSSLSSPISDTRDSASSRNSVSGCTYDCCPGGSNASCPGGASCSMFGATCDSTVCSVADSASSSHSSLQGESDEESDRRCVASSADCSDDERSVHALGCSTSCSSSTTLSPRMGLHSLSSRPLRPAIRLPSSSGLSQPTRLGESRKSVTFDAGGTVICSPPTEETLCLLAAGTPTLSISASLSSSSRASGDALARVPTVDTEVSQRHTKAASAAYDRSFGRTAATSATASTLQEAQTPRPRARVTVSQPGVPLQRTAASAQLLRAVTVAGTSPSNHLPTYMDSAHTTALARAAAGRRRVRAALEEARNRHFHLGQSSQTLVTGWSHATHVPNPNQQLQITAANQTDCLEESFSIRGHLGQEGRSGYPSTEKLRPTRLPNLPLASGDLDILSVGYAAAANKGCSSTPSTAAVTVAIATGARAHADQDGAATVVAASATPSSALAVLRSNGHYMKGEQQHHAETASATDSSQPTSIATRAVARAAINAYLPACKESHSSWSTWLVRLNGRGAASLSQFAPAERLRLAEAVAKQSHPSVSKITAGH